MNASDFSLTFSEVSIFPNDVGGLGGFCEKEFGFHQFKLGSFLFTEKAFYWFEVLGKNIGIFFFKSNESAYWSSEFFILFRIIL